MKIPVLITVRQRSRSGFVLETEQELEMDAGSTCAAVFDGLQVSPFQLPDEIAADEVVRVVVDDPTVADDPPGATRALAAIRRAVR